MENNLLPLQNINKTKKDLANLFNIPLKTEPRTFSSMTEMCFDVFHVNLKFYKKYKEIVEDTLDDLLTIDYTTIINNLRVMNNTNGLQKTIGKNIDQFMKYRGHRSIDFNEDSVLEINERTIQLIKSGNQLPSIKQLLIIADTLKVPFPLFFQKNM